MALRKSKASTRKTLPKQRVKQPQRRRHPTNVSRYSSTSVTAPVSMSTVLRSSTAPRPVIIRHREVIGLVTASSTAGNYSALALPLQPGLNLSFPWLSQLALAFEKYRFKSLKYSYVPECSTQVPGNVALMFDYDCKDGAPPDMISLMTGGDYVSTPVWQSASMTYHPPLASELSHRYIRVGAPTGDQASYDAGQLIVASNGVSTASLALGYIFCDYEVELMVPQYASSNNAGMSECFAVSSLAGNGSTVSAPFGLNSSTITYTSYGGVTPVWGGTTQINFLVPYTGYYKISFIAAGGSITGLNALSIASTGSTLANAVITASQSTRGESDVIVKLIQGAICYINQTGGAISAYTGCNLFVSYFGPSIAFLV